RRRHTRLQGDWSSDVCSSDLLHLRLHRIDLRELLVHRFNDGGLLGKGRKSDERRPHILKIEGLSRNLMGLTSHLVYTGWISEPRSEERRVGKECRSRGWG